MSKRHLLIVLWLAGSAATEAVAQAPRLRPGDEIRVFAGGVLYSGRVRTASGHELMISDHSNRRAVALADVDSLYVARRATVRSGLIGALVGLGIGAAVGTVVGEGDPLGDTPPIAYTAFGAGAGLLGGGIIGALIGGKRWRKAYP
jgi:hypothetical protein